MKHAVQWPRREMGRLSPTLLNLIAHNNNVKDADVRDRITIRLHWLKGRLSVGLTNETKKYQRSETLVIGLYHAPPPTFVLVTYIKQLVFLPGFAPDMNRSLPTFLIVVRGLFLYLLILMHARLLLNHFPLYRLGVLYFNYSWLAYM